MNNITIKTNQQYTITTSPLTIIVEPHVMLSISIDAPLDSLDLTIVAKKDTTITATMLCKKSMAITLNLQLIEPGASITIKGAYLLYDNQQVAIKVAQQHTAAHCTSDVLFKGVLYDASQATYYGNIFVDKGAIQTVAAQENKNLLMSDAAKAIAMPTLEVLTDDVKCSHATASGFIDKEHMFYLASRGLDVGQAQQLLIESFLADCI